MFLSKWEETGKPHVNVAVVGKGTAQPLEAKGIKPFFQSSEFTAVILAKELPTDRGLNVLYPTSSLADKTLQAGLAERGFNVIIIQHIHVSFVYDMCILTYTIVYYTHLYVKLSTIML